MLNAIFNFVIYFFYKIFSIKTKNFYYVLPMIAYPSGELHIGHIRTYTYLDLISKYYKYFKKYDVFIPFGFDAFGLPAENYARQIGSTPEIVTKNTIQEMTNTIKLYNFSFSIKKDFITSNKDYQIQQQKIIKKMFENGYCSVQKTVCNWDPIDQTYLANEQVINGRGWRSNAQIEYLIEDAIHINIRSVAKELVEELDNLDWSKNVISAQRKWIGGEKFSYFFIKNMKIYINPKIDYEFSIDMRNPILHNIFEKEKMSQIIKEVELNKIYKFYLEEIDSTVTVTKDLNYSIYNVESNGKLDNIKIKGKENVYRLRNWCIERNKNWGCPLNPLKIEVHNSNVTKTMDTFVDSSWYSEYFLQISNYISKPVDFYAGGIEHACMHLVYSRAFFKIMKKIGYDVPEEPYKKFVALGMVLHEAWTDENNNYIEPNNVNLKCKSVGIFKMSKSKKNIISAKSLLVNNNNYEIKMALVSDSPIYKDFEWKNQRLKSCKKLFDIFKQNYYSKSNINDNYVKVLETKLEEYLINGNTNLIVSSLFTCVTYIKNQSISNKSFLVLKNILKLFK